MQLHKIHNQNFNLVDLLSKLAALMDTFYMPKNEIEMIGLSLY